MESFNQLIEAQVGPILLGLTFLTVALAIFNLVQWRIRKRQVANDNSANESLSGSGDKTARLISDIGLINSSMDKLEGRLVRLEDQMMTSKRFVGLVRYDAFDDVGGKQSFSLAVYDENGDGAIVTSQVGRMDCRVYAKSLIGGQAEAELSQEEMDALRSAVKSKEVV